MIRCAWLPSLLLILLLLQGFPVLAAPGPTTDSGDVYNKQLAYAVRFGQPADVTLLLSKGADPNRDNESGWPLVSVAASRHDGNSLPIMRALVKAGADVNQGGPNAMFPVVLAARDGDTEMMNFLLDDAHANYDVKDLNGIGTREIAASGGYDAIVAKINQLQAAKDTAEQDRHSPARQKTLYHDLLFQSCAGEYMKYYFQSKQDTIDPSHSDAVLNDWHAKYARTEDDLLHIFGAKPKKIKVLNTAARGSVYDQLEDMVSTRNRRAHHVGSDDDLNKRCGYITEKLFPYADASMDQVPQTVSAPSHF